MIFDSSILFLNEKNAKMQAFSGKVYMFIKKEFKQRHLR